MDPHPRYQLLEKLGSGSYATVYRARDLELGREVAVKQLHEQFLQDPQQLERYWAEAQLLASFPHPNIVTIYDIVRDRGWLILELMQGSLAKVAGRKPMDLGALKATIAHCLRALKFLHEHGVVHGDVKPGNMMIDRRKRVKLGDFGLARRVSDAEGSLIKGTTKYMAPEVVSEDFGSVGPASDLYSLGFAAFELMCGENFESLFPGLSAFGRDKQMAWMMWHAAPDRRLPEIRRVLEGVPEDLAKCLEKLTAKSQAQRYKSADEALSDLHIDLKLVKTGEDAGEPRPEGPSEETKRRRLVIGACAMSMILSLLMLIPWGSKSKPSVANIPGVAGVVREISVSSGKLEILDDDGMPTEVSVGETPRIQLDYEKYILLKDLHKGDRVEIKTIEDAKGVKTITISALRPEQSRGVIRSINVPDQTLIVSVDEGRTDVPLRASKGSKLTLNGRGVSLGELKLDDRVEVLHLKNSAAVASRQVTKLTAFRTTLLVGFVNSVDLAKKIVTVDQPGGRENQLVSYEIADPCTMTLNGETQIQGKPFALADLQKGDRVVLRHDVRITDLAATRRPRLTGVVMQTAEAPPTITVRTSDGQNHLFQVEGNTEVFLNRAVASLIELRGGDNVNVTYDPKDDGRIARSVDVERPAKVDRLAVLISVDNYRDKRLSQLRTSRADAQLLKDAFLERYAFASQRILFLSDPDKAALLSGLSDWLKKSDNLTQVWVYFSGNAYADDHGTVYLAAADTKWDNLAGTGIKLETFIEQMESSVAREKIFLLDASHAGEGPDRKMQPSTAEMMESLALSAGGSPLKSVSVIASCRKSESGQLWREKEHGVFPWFIADALTGRADKNRDLLISARELYDYLRQTMTDASGPSQPPQTPVLFQR